MNKLIEQIRLKHRAFKYLRREDPGGIRFMLNNISPGEAVFDIGAHKGGYTYFMQRAVGRTGLVIAIEPQRRLHEYLMDIKHLFKWDNVEVHRYAVSDSIEQTQLYLPDNSSPGATLHVPVGRTDFNSAEPVQTITLDKFCSVHGLRPSFIKIDAEGAELGIFKGAVDVLRHHQPRILVEIEARHVGADKLYETFDFMRQLGYNGFFIPNYAPDKTPVPIHRFSIVNHQNLQDMKHYCNNFVFVYK